MAQISCCVFDLETSNLNADFGVVLCGVVKSAYGKPKIFRADRLNKKWRASRSDDSAVVRAIVKELEQYDIWSGHNASRFDVPYLRTRLLKHGFPPLPARKLIDPLQLARNKLRMSFNSLAQVANLLGCNSKTDVNPDIWLRASLDGCKQAMNYIVSHCVEDVFTLEKVLDALKHYSSTLNTWGSGF